MIKFLVFVFIWLGSFLSIAQTAKVVGYFPTYRFNLYNSIDFCKLTHLNLSFANPDSVGNLKINNFSTVANTAKQKNPDIIICVSLGGGGVSDLVAAYWANLIDIPAKRSAFISKIIDFVQLNNLDGVDFDIEWKVVTSGYSDFVIQLNDSLKNYDKLFTVALPGTHRYPQITNNVLAVFDFVNIMAYSETGPWSPNNPGQHSSFDFAQRAIVFWKNHGVPSEKLILGVPFYGFNFEDPNNVYAFTYSNMVNTNILYADLDDVEDLYYNGRPTIEKKVELAAESTGGIMIWEVGQDRFDEYSLLSTIHDKYNSLGFVTTGLCGNTVRANQFSENNLKIYPNPTRSILNIELNNYNNAEVIIWNLLGEKINILPEKGFNKLVFNVSGLQKGMYLVTIQNSKTFGSFKFVVQ